MTEFPVPDLTIAALRPFWDAAAAGRLVFPRCGACGAFCWYPRPSCPECCGGDFAWTEIGGKARLFSWSVVRRALHPPLKAIAPYIPVILEFDAAPGVRLVSRWIGDPDSLRMGMEVRVAFADLGHPRTETGIQAPLACEPSS
jgi:uncharacterized OB-fold protein